MKSKPVSFRKNINVAPEALRVPADASMEQRVITAMRTVFDPEISVNIYDLGLIYEVNINEDAEVLIAMTLTSPGCPVAGILPGKVADAVKAIDGINDAKVELVWDPPWNQDCMSDEAKLSLGLFY